MVYSNTPAFSTLAPIVGLWALNVLRNITVKNHTSSCGNLPPTTSLGLLLLHTWLLLYLLLYQFNNFVSIHSFIYLSGTVPACVPPYKEVTFKGFNLVLIQLSRYVCKVLVSSLICLYVSMLYLGQKRGKSKMLLLIFIGSDWDQ